MKKLRAPVGTTAEPVTTHRFVYDCQVKKEGKRKKLLEGYTEVFDALNHKSKYEFDKEHRLTSIIKYTGTTKQEYHPYSKECFEWGKDKDEGNLVKKVFKDGMDNIHHYRTFDYDERGNVKKSALHGNLTGSGNEEQETKTYTYSDDGFNLLLSETDSNGVLTEYRYKHGTSHLKSRLVRYEGKIRSREFYYYENDILIKKVIDDGDTEHDQDLSGVTERYYTMITPRTVPPIGLPQEVEEKYLDNGEKKPLKKTKNSYSSFGQLTKQEVFDAKSNPVYTLEWGYDKHGNLTSETNAMGDVVIREYDDNDNLIFEQGPTTQFYIKNEYDFANRLICQKETHGDNKKFTTDYAYNYLGQCEKITNSYELTTVQTFDELGRVTETKYPAVLNEKGKLVKPVVKKAYDIAGYLVSLIDAKNQETKNAYNVRGQPTKIEYPDGTSETMFYRLDGQLMEKKEKNGLRTVYKRDPLGRVTEEAHCQDQTELRKTIHAYNSFHLMKTIDAEGVITSYSYDKAGRINKIEQGERRQENVYDDLGHLSEIREFYGQESNQYRATKKRYDRLDRLTDETLHDGEGPALHTSHFEYDARGNRTVVQTGEDKTETRYDGHDNPILITNALGKETHVVYHTDFENDLGQKVSQTATTDPLGYQTIDTYDAANRLVKTERRNPFGMKVAHQTILYDLNGNPCEYQNEVIEEGKVKKVIITKMTYTADNQIASLTEAAGTEEQKITAYSYKLGQKETTIKPDHITLTYTYDPLGRLATLKSSDESISYTYVYDKLDQVREVRDKIAKTTTIRNYDALCQLEKETLANGLTLNYTYDRIGRIETIHLPDQCTIDYVYNGVDLKEIKRKGYSHRNLSHTQSGEITRTKPPGKNGEIAYEYNALRRCTKINARSFQQEIPIDGFDDVGNLLQFSSQGNAYNFTYDDHYHLQSEKGHVEHTYLFDSLANRIEKDKEVHEHNALNQLVNEKLHYDPNGNLIKHAGAHYTYDALDRLIRAEVNGTVTNYTYDPFNRRLSKNQELFVYQGQEEIGSWVNNAFQELLILGKNGHNPVALELKGTPYVPLSDLSGNIVALLTLQGEVAERYRYTVFGETEVLSPIGKKLPTSTLHNPYQYAAKRLDPETGLIAFGLRYYIPSLGRWLTPDPAGDVDGPNLYAYVHNNPLRYFDRLGLYSDEFDCSWDPVFPTYFIASTDDIYHGFAGTLHGGLDFATHQVTGVGSLCCSIGAHEWDDHLERNFSTLAFNQSCAKHINRFDNWFANALHVDTNNVIYQNFHSVTHRTMEISSLATGGYGLIKGGLKLAALSSISKGSELSTGIALRNLQSTTKIEFLGTLESRINQLSAMKEGLNLNALSRAGQALDRCGLTRAGRALDKHGGRPGSVFPRAMGNTASRNIQGHFQLDDILTHPQSSSLPNRLNGFDIFAPDGRGVRFDANFNFTGFLQPRRFP